MQSSGTAELTSLNTLSIGGERVSCVVGETGELSMVEAPSERPPSEGADGKVKVE